MKIKLLTILSFYFFLFAFAQKQKSKSIPVRLASYPTELPIKDLDSYAIKFLDKAQRALPFNEGELEKALTLESFTNNIGEELPDLFFAVQGVGVDDIKTTIKRYGRDKKYTVYSLPKSNTKISIMLMVDGEPRQILDFPVTVKMGSDKKPLATITTFSFDDADKYLDFTDVDSAKPTPTLVKDFLEKSLGERFLTETLVPRIKSIYDYGSKEMYQTFYYIKDKKNKPLKDESKQKILDFRDTIFAKINSLDELREYKNQFTPYITYWKNLYEKYKSVKKPAWAMLVNLHLTAMIMEDMPLAEEYLNKLIALETKSWATRSLKNNFKRFKESYDMNHNLNGERIYAENYTLDKRIANVLKNEEKERNAKANDIVNATGYLISSKNEKFEGNITLKFSKEDRKEQGNIFSLDGGTIPGKSVTIKYKNARGKTRIKTFKAKKVKVIVAGKKTYKPINPETDALNKVANALNFAFNNIILMKEIYKSEKIGLYLSHESEGVYYLKFPNKDKAQYVKMNSDSSFITSTSELFKDCTLLVEKIKKEEFKNTEKDLVEICKLFSTECK